MKILLDENIDIRFKTYLTAKGFEVFTVKEMKWNGLSNGTLLQLIKENKFDCWIVVDKNIPHQQNITKIPCQIIVLDVHRNTLKHLIAFVADVVDLVKQASDKTVVVLKRS